MFSNIEDNNDKDTVNLFILPDGTETKVTVVPLFQIAYIEDSGFGAYSCEDEVENQFTIKGTFMQPLVIGQTYLAEGKVSSYDSKYGPEKQLTVEKIRNTKPMNEKGIISYLQTLKGLKTRAYDIYEIYGDKSIDILMENPMDVANTVPGVGRKSVMSWQEQLEKMKDSQETMMALLNFGLTIKESKKLYEKYGDSVIQKIEGNPYILSKEVKGFGFLTCDRIARNIGYSPKSLDRIEEGVIHILEESTNEGHIYLPSNELVKKATDLLAIRLTIQEMNQFLKEYKTDFKYEIGDNLYDVSYEDMAKCLNQYNNASKWNQDKLRYIVVEISDDEVIQGINILKLQNRIIVQKEKIYIEELYQAEQEVAKHVRRIMQTEHKIDWDVKSELDKYCINNNIELEDRQKESVINFSSSTGGFFILNGHAGCGKTFTLKVILEMLGVLYTKLNKTARIALLAPTGKASKVATKATNIECLTVHRRLGYNPQQGFEHDESNPLEEDIVIIDESSMLDTLLSKNLFSAVKNGSKVILLGDTKQLPSVGAGNILSDLIESKKIDIVTLNVVKRQGEQSGIIKNANAIIEGKMIESREDTKDAYIIKRETSEGVHEAIIQSIKRIQEIKGYSLSEIQLLCPQRAGAIGVEYMNYLLQQTFNPDKGGNKILNKNLLVKLDPQKTEVKNLKLNFTEGDKVIHIKNNYDMPWYKKTSLGYEDMGEDFSGITNGECGVIEEIRKVRDNDGTMNNEVIVKYDDMYIVYDDGVKEIDHAFALTIHKSQGSQWPAVIIPMMMQNYIMLDNNLFYTAYTRASEFSTIIGQEKAMNHAVKTYRSRERYTTLKEIL